MDVHQSLITDKGCEFVNQLSAPLFSITRTEHRVTFAYPPRRNVTRNGQHTGEDLELVVRLLGSQDL